MKTILPPHTTSPELPGYTTEAVAGTYSLFATAMNPGSSGPETLVNGLANYGRAVLVIRFFQMLFNISRYGAWFVAAMFLGGIGVLMAITGVQREGYMNPVIGIGFFCYLSPTICLCYLLPYMVRGRILPYRGKLVMHGDPALNKQMTGDILRVGIIAAALSLPYVIVGFLTERYLTMYAGTMMVGEGDDAEPDYTEAKIVTRYYPRPASDLGALLLFSPVIGGMAFMGYKNLYGSWAGEFTTFMSILVLVLYGYGIFLYVQNRARIRVTDIAFILTAGMNNFHGYNYLIAFEPNLEEKANNPYPDYDPEPYQRALEFREEFDKVMTEYFENMDTVTEPIHIIRG